jgi:hypothetical protein
MQMKIFFALAPICIALGGCEENAAPPLPPLLRNATAVGGSNFLCQPGLGQASTPETASHSPQIQKRLDEQFPPGTASTQLRDPLVRQGFQIHLQCSPDNTVSWAEFSQKSRDGILDIETGVFGTVYWKEDANGRIVWASGNVAYTGL